MQREHLQTVKASAETLLVVINDILDFSKIEAGKLVLDVAEFDLRALATMTLKPLTLRAQQNGLQLHTVLAESLPQRVFGDSVRIGQVLTNLVGNAIKFTPHGGIEVGLETDAQAPQMLHFWVKDSGIGIPAEKQKTIFEAFTQADNSTTRHYGGTGLGLTISSNLVHLMGGRIWLDSAPGVGSIFHFSLRLPVVQSTAAVVAAPASMAVSDEMSLRVLLVEDHPINQMLAIKLMERAGHRVTLAQNGQEGLDAFVAQDFDAVLMDMQMPVMDGLQATRAIRAYEAQHGARHTPIIAMTANVQASDRQACAEAGMDDFLSKPFKADDLRRILAQLNAPESS